MTDYETLAANIEEMTEMIRAVVAALVADGFTDEQARTIVTRIWASAGKKDTP